MLADRLTPTRLRQLAILPLVFFLAQGIHYWQINQLGHMLWMCNIGNLVLAAGLFLEKPVLVRVAALWMVPGVGVWFLYYVMPNWGKFLSGGLSYSEVFGILSSTLAHIGGFIVGMIVLARIRVDRLAWLYAFGWYFLVQLASRLITPAELNVNLAHNIQPGWEQTFSSYWKFWLVLTLTTAVCLWLLGLLLQKLWPAAPGEIEGPVV
ncbi:MAG TPA: hypothetical protein VLL54_08905 [Pyrinomonadaceae bacterium]|nr:hypothetical protein [Pyrinomonadaceae bacterium]